MKDTIELVDAALSGAMREPHEADGPETSDGPKLTRQLRLSIPSKKRFIRVYEGAFEETSLLHPFTAGETACSLGAWVDLVGQAEWRKSGSLPRGQFETSFEQLAERWNWSRDDVTGFLRWLYDNGVIGADKDDDGKIIITITDYPLYNGRMRGNSSRDPNNNQKEEKKKKNKKKKADQTYVRDYPEWTG
jgi:hypothetical protein